MHYVERSQLFELLAMCGMLMDFNWTEILKRREILRLDFALKDYYYSFLIIFYESNINK